MGPGVINSWKFYICRLYPSIPYRLLMYALVTCPHLQYFEMISMKTRLKIRLSPSQQIRDPCEIKKNDPFGMSQDCLKFVRFEGFPRTQDCLDLISGYLPYIESILCVSPISGQSRFTTIFNLQSITLNLTAFQELKTFCMDIQTLVGYNGRNAFDYLFFHIKYAGQEEEEEQVFYSLRKGDRPYKLTPTTQRLILDACQNEVVFNKIGCI